MRLEHQRQSSNIEDRRGRRMAGPVGLGGGGIGMIVIILLVSWLTGTEPADAPAAGRRRSAAVRRPASNRRRRRPTTPGGVHRPRARQPRGHLGRDLRAVATVTSRPCSSSSPMPCSRRAAARHRPPGRSTARRTRRYLDLSFFRELDQRFGAPAISLRPTWSPTRSAITSRRCSASTSRSRDSSSRRRRGRGQPALGPARAAGRLLRRHLGPHAARNDLPQDGDVDEGSPPPRPSATTACRGRLRAASSPRASPTGRRRSAPSGCAAAWRRAGSRTATPSPGAEGPGARSPQLRPALRRQEQRVSFLHPERLVEVRDVPYRPVGAEPLRRVRVGQHLLAP